jgi:hypothetical protein
MGKDLENGEISNEKTGPERDVPGDSGRNGNTMGDGMSIDVIREALEGAKAAFEIMLDSARERTDMTDEGLANLFNVTKDRIDQALTALAEIDQWRDIETAPRDGTHILLLTSDCGAVEGFWNPDILNYYKNSEYCIDYQPGTKGEWCSNWRTFGDNAESRLYCGATPTHWKPIGSLPTPPKGE